MSFISRNFCRLWWTLLHAARFKNLFIVFLDPLLTLEHLGELTLLYASDMSGVAFGRHETLC